jgi:hypothetical protein
MSITSPILRRFLNLDAPVVMREDGTYTAPAEVGWHNLGSYAAVFFLWGGPNVPGCEWWRLQGGLKMRDGTPGVWFAGGLVSFAFVWYGFAARFADEDDDED